MAFYDNVKDRVRDQNTESTGEGDDTDDSEGDNVAFDELIKNAQEQDDNDEEEQQEDDTEIEDFSGGSPDSGDYGDPSSIELNEDDEPQAGRQGNNKSETTEAQASTTESPSPEPQDGANDSTQATPDEEPESEVELHQDGSVGDPGSEPEETVEREESELTVLQEIRNQNEQMLGLLRAIKKDLEQR
jgi:hypothetical protein